MEGNKKIDKAIAYYQQRRDMMMRQINQQSDNTVHFIVKSGEQLNELEAKISCLQIARNN